MPLEDFIITVFCLVEDHLQKILLDTKLRTRGFLPKLSDSEVITMDVVGEFKNIATDIGIWRYFKTHWKHFFPEIGSRANYVKQSAALWKIKQEMQKIIAASMGAKIDTLHMSDGFPMPICHFKRAFDSQCFQGIAAYGYCASKDEIYYGFKGNLVISSEGIITGITVTAANIDERESLWEIAEDLKGMMIADKGLIGEDFQRDLNQELGLNLQTSRRSNMKDTRGKFFNRWLVSTRRLVETVIGQLAGRFSIERVLARDLWHLTNRVNRKILAHTIAIWINKSLGNPPLQFELLEAR